jgi:hypothetical protein
VSHPELGHEVEVHDVEVHPDAVEEQPHPDEDSRHEYGVDCARDAVEVVGESPDDGEQEGEQDDPETGLDEPGETA